MPRYLNYLNHEDCPTEDDKDGWEFRAGETWDVPLWMERMGMLELPDWMRNEDGTCNVNYKASMGTDKPQMLVTSLADPAAATPTAPQDLCRPFAETGSCEFGARCPYAHVRDADADDPRLKTPTQPKAPEKSYDQIMREARERREDEAGKKVRVCALFNSFDGCKKGVYCINRHIEDNHGDE